MNPKLIRRCLSLLFLAACTIALQAPAAARAAQDQATPEAKRPRALPMVLTLTNDTKLRVRACLVGEHWEIKTADGMRQIPSQMVVRAVLEAELLREAKTLKRASEKQPVRRAAYADWMATQGLKVEALKELDRLLREDPELEAARGVIERQAFRLDLPPVSHSSSIEEIQALISAAIRWGPAGREAAAQALSHVEPSPALQQVLLENLVSHNASRRSFATLGLRRAVTGQHMQPLMRRAVLDPDEEVRTGAALALGAFEEPKLVGPVLRAMGSKSSRVRMNASAALGNMGYPSAVAPLLSQLNSLQSSAGRKPHANFYSGNQQAYIQDFDVEVASNSSIADPVINVLTEGVVLDVGVLSVTERSIVQERATIRRSLSKLTGASPGTSTEHWMKWWDENRRSYAPAKQSTPTHTTSREL